ncbi:hypothetical protein Tco_0942065 [Tanacetum coccineum]|uniref:Uncharacterized protein n=1 Tax=Tanacetum coccineum TaxID=301880 RepID=A0ABQ5DSM3_9ASTR
MSDIEIETYEDEPYEIKRDLAEDSSEKDPPEHKEEEPLPALPNHHTVPLLVAHIAHHEREIHSLEDQLDDLLHGKLETIQEEVDGLYAVVEAAQQDVETLQATLREAWEQIADMQFYLD